MSEENVELAKSLVPPPGADLGALLRDEHSFAQMREALCPLVAVLGIRLPRIGWAERE
jgi:hypothetical protein